MKQIARNATMEDCGVLRDCRYLLHDRDTKFTRSFRAIIASGRIEPLALPPRSANLNAYAERWVRSVKEECLSKVILFGERSLRRALTNYVDHFHAERNHQGKGNACCFLGQTIGSAMDLCGAASDWAGSCAITIERRRDVGFQDSRDRQPRSGHRTPAKCTRRLVPRGMPLRFVLKCPQSTNLRRSIALFAGARRSLNCLAEPPLQQSAHIHVP
jgi:hypothetical protein